MNQSLDGGTHECKIIAYVDAHRALADSAPFEENAFENVAVASSCMQGPALGRKRRGGARTARDGARAGKIDFG